MSVLEVVNHLADEEVEDFRARFQRTLADPEAPWPPIDPRGWVEARAYRERDPAASLARFLAERASSVSMLRGLPACDLDVAYAHPSLGVQRAGDLLAAWLAHDLIHVRQINRLRYLWLEREAEPYRLGYAGPF